MSFFSKKFGSHNSRKPETQKPKETNIGHVVWDKEVEDYIHELLAEPKSSGDKKDVEKPQKKTAGFLNYSATTSKNL